MVVALGLPKGPTQTQQPVGLQRTVAFQALQGYCQRRGIFRERDDQMHMVWHHTVAQQGVAFPIGIMQCPNDKS